MEAILELFFELTANSVFLISKRQCQLAWPKNPLNQLKPALLVKLTSANCQPYQIITFENHYYVGVTTPKQQLAVFKSQYELIDTAFINEIKLFYYLIWQKFLTSKQLPTKQKLNPTLVFDKVHKTSHDERQILLAISQGNIQKFKQLHRQFWFNSGQFGTLDTQSNLRNQKNLAIAWITLATRAAITGRLADEKAYQLSDHLIQQLEQKKQLDLQDFNEEVGLIFARQVNENQLGQLSHEISAVCHYLQTNYAKKITLEQLVQLFCLSKGHLQRKFKQQVGLTVIEYLQQQRLQAACELLSYTNLSINQIANQVGFESVSYFIKLFNRQFAQTPLQWRLSQ